MAKTTRGQNVMHARRRHRTNPTLFCGLFTAGRWGDSVWGACLFMMDVRMLMLIIGVGRNAAALE
jgi:hypothetical protein